MAKLVGEDGLCAECGTTIRILNARLAKARKGLWHFCADHQWAEFKCHNCGITFLRRRGAVYKVDGGEKGKFCSWPCFREKFASPEVGRNFTRLKYVLAEEEKEWVKRGIYTPVKIPLHLRDHPKINKNLF